MNLKLFLILVGAMILFTTSVYYLRVEIGRINSKLDYLVSKVSGPDGGSDVDGDLDQRTSKFYKFTLESKKGVNPFVADQDQPFSGGNGLDSITDPALRKRFGPETSVFQLDELARGIAPSCFKEPDEKGIAGNRGGLWSACTHLLTYGLNFDFPLADFLLAFEGRRVLELGCGLGLYSEYLTRFTADDNARAPHLVVGVEPADMQMSGVFGRPPRPVQVVADVVSGDDVDRSLWPAFGLFDLVVCVEVGEHVPRHLHDNLFDFLTSRSSKWIVFAGATPGQGGHGHISERPEAEWQQEIESRGFHRVDMLTDYRKYMKQGCHRNNALVFMRDDAGPSDDEVQRIAGRMKRLLEDSPSQKKQEQLWPELSRIREHLIHKPRNYSCTGLQNCIS